MKAVGIILSLVIYTGAHINDVRMIRPIPQITNLYEDVFTGCLYIKVRPDYYRRFYNTQKQHAGCRK